MHLLSPSYLHGWYRSYQAKDMPSSRITRVPDITCVYAYQLVRGFFVVKSRIGRSKGRATAATPVESRQRRP